ncbi:endo alpha-1,4 polygalactosaminidase [Inquilinus sp.]|uniref:endo alpha-1,4 polygalactosaminidase n=1 Tax=Inquilinus sp. TaxID=1932117 RepID=UPI0031D366EB
MGRFCRSLLVAAALVAGAAASAHADDPQPAAAGWWKPTSDKPLSFHWVLGGPLNINDPVQMGLRDFNGAVLPEPDVYDIDGEFNSKATVDALHARGKKVICYIDVGVYETYRGDAAKFRRLVPRIWGKPDIGWDNSFWLDIRRIRELEPIMKARMQMCKDKGFDAIEPDEIDGWENSLDPATNRPSATKGETGFPLTYQDQLAYNRALARWAHEIGMSIGQKGDIIQIRDLVASFDWTLNEQCYQYGECLNPYDPILDRAVPGLQLYTRANKAVFVAEYKAFTTAQWAAVCKSSRASHFNAVRFRLQLPPNGRRQPCINGRTW